jgi:pyruvate dehydrogenase E1 component alpha subunit
MVLIRRFEQKAAQAFMQAKIKGFCHLYIGQEALAVGSISTLNRTDAVITAYRDHGHALARGMTSRECMAELFGKITGCSRGKGGSMHFFNKEKHFHGGHGIVGGQTPLAAGIAFAQKYNGTGEVTVCYLGDGAVNQGAFHESLNLAALWKLPILFVVENNKWAIGMAHERATSQPEIYKKAEVFNMVGVEVDGMDLLAVHSVAEEAVARARAGEGPTLIEALTYRFRGHSLADPDELRSPDEKQFWGARDPIQKFAAYLTEYNLASSEELKEVDQKVQAIIDEAVKFAESSPEPDPSELYRFIFGENE